MPTFTVWRMYAGAEWTTDGEPVFAGRADGQVKIRGLVEPGGDEPCSRAWAARSRSMIIAGLTGKTTSACDGHIEHGGDDEGGWRQAAGVT